MNFVNMPVCFHPLKSGRNKNPSARHRKRRTSFHPLKSGRNWRNTSPELPEGGFHPLKSGRNPFKGIGQKSRTTVSIPSSRVGTECGTDFARLATAFPSPQVGSEQVAQPAKIQTCKFPSPQVGSELGVLSAPASLVSRFPSPQVGSEPHGAQHRLVHDLVSIPSSRVGTSPIAPLFANEQNVSIPSSRVGTGETKRWGKGKILFPSPQVGSEQLMAKSVATFQPSFHPLKSGRNPP